jgi:hypothetical protein
MIKTLQDNNSKTKIEHAWQRALELLCSTKVVSRQALDVEGWIYQEICSRMSPYEFDGSVTATEIQTQGGNTKTFCLSATVALLASDNAPPPQRQSVQATSMVQACSIDLETA